MIFCDGIEWVEDRDKLVSLMPAGSICAEIGVKEGNFSAVIMKTAAQEIHLIDPWAKSEALGFLKVKPEQWEEWYRIVQELAKNDKRVKVHRGLSEDVLPTFADNYFDWIYIDGNHRRPWVDRDLTWSYQKVKPNGFILGHDFDLAEVYTAVLELLNTRKVKMRYLASYLASDQYGHTSFGLRKVRTVQSDESTYG